MAHILKTVLIFPERYTFADRSFSWHDFCIIKFMKDKTSHFERMMILIGILVVTHGEFGKELLKSAELILGKQEKVMCLGLNEGDDVLKLKDKVRKGIIDLDEGEGVLVLTDMFGGSPFNVTSANLKELTFNYLTGVNLPMLIEALSSRHSYDVNTLAEMCYKSGIEGIRNMNKEILSK
ncbi:PTS sugar transporter subunit IIA [Thermoanaerobacterium sp. PSU-2]|uniref:PTS sugar transporter subunit IIA n=1 Tax=Thermoanaerobacterium sp. PSU-2 TaxID=1930849 RepID=UPI001F0AC0EE|nr:PTS sugar transporter subunit IIA [Thermoanaerobacterium sp. PSU-2]